MSSEFMFSIDIPTGNTMEDFLDLESTFRMLANYCHFRAKKMFSEVGPRNDSAVANEKLYSQMMDYYWRDMPDWARELAFSL